LASGKKLKKHAQVHPTSGPKWAFGKALQELRQQKEISQEALAEAAGLDRSFISLVERGIIVVLLKIAEVLKVPATNLVARTEEIMRA
jgi:transcriptional regulator with XRE-family HTH domain